MSYNHTSKKRKVTPDDPHLEQQPEHIASNQTTVQTSEYHEVIVPFNFGIKNLYSRVHGNIALKLQDNTEMKANSLILSYNSPVFEHMIVNLEMFSVDIDDFTVDAVRLFVQALYTGRVELTMQHFRDINKMSHVFKVFWLARRCKRFFGYLVEDLNNTDFQGLLFLFEEAFFSSNATKNNDYMDIFVEKISAAPDKLVIFVERFMNLDYFNLSTNQMDIMILIAVKHVEVLIKIMKTNIEAQGKILDDNSKYLLQNVNLVNLMEQNKHLFDEFFDYLVESVETTSIEDMRMVVKLNRYATKEYLIKLQNVTVPQDLPTLPTTPTPVTPQTANENWPLPGIEVEMLDSFEDGQYIGQLGYIRTVRTVAGQLSTVWLYGEKKELECTALQMKPVVPRMNDNVVIITGNQRGIYGEIRNILPEDIAVVESVKSFEIELRMTKLESLAKTRYKYYGYPRSWVD